MRNAVEAGVTGKNRVYKELALRLRLRLRSGRMFFIYDKSSISVLFPQMTFVLNFTLNKYDLKEGHPSLIGRVTCPTAYSGLDLYLRKIS